MIMSDVVTRHHDVLRAIRSRRKIRYDEVLRYVRRDEELVGYGTGGSESLTLFLRRGRNPTFVRKVTSQLLAAAHWERTGTGIMSPPHRKARLQVAYLQNLPASARPYFPEIIDVHETWDVPGRMRESSAADGELPEYVVDQSYVPGVEVSSFVREAQPGPSTVAHLYAEILRLLDLRLHTHRRRAPADHVLERYHLRKVEERLELAHRTAPAAFPRRLFEVDHFYVNGRKLANLPAILRVLRSVNELAQVFEPPRLCLTMGDMNTENVKITRPDRLLAAMHRTQLQPSFDDMGLRLLDPRAIGVESEGSTTVDDPIYDFKFWHNSLAHYDLLHGEHFAITVEQRRGVPYVNLAPARPNPYEISYAGLATWFTHVFERGLSSGLAGLSAEDPHWVPRFALLMGTHICGMTPFHFSRGIDGGVVDDWRVQRRPVALYCEGIWWLNLAIAVAEVPATALDYLTAALSKSEAAVSH
jgi:hypothetical protein